MTLFHHSVAELQKGVNRQMCGIVGLHLKRRQLEPRLGELVAPMLECMASRGADSTGLAVYSRNNRGLTKYSLHTSALNIDWTRCAQLLGDADAQLLTHDCEGRSAVIASAATVTEVKQTLRGFDPTIQIFGYGSEIEVFKGLGSAHALCQRQRVRSIAGHRAIGHTRMATESAVTIAHSHPFCSGSDLALVHNGSFTNYNSVRRDLIDCGLSFDTDNDTEVAARFVDYRIGQGDELGDAMKHVLATFDGFFTLVVATTRSFAVVRDPIACKPLVIAENDDYVAVASEFVALTHLPAIRDAHVFEPAPEEILAWTS